MWVDKTYKVRYKAIWRSPKGGRYYKHFYGASKVEVAKLANTHILLYLADYRVTFAQLQYVVNSLTIRRADYDFNYQKDVNRNKSKGVKRWKLSTKNRVGRDK